MFSILETAKKDMNLPKQVKIFDTTLRDGEQTPGVSLAPEDKLVLARQLDKVGVDIIEAGFPVASKGEMEAVRSISKEGLNSTICGLSRVKKPDIEACLDADVGMVHTFIPTSDIQIKHTVKKSKEEIVQLAVDAVTYIKDHGIPCLFSAMDASRTDVEYLIRINKEVESAGADILNIPDTVGVMIPAAMKILTAKVLEAVDVPVDVHCHNDFGLAVPNTLAAVEAGAREVQVAINGLGERAGNANLEEVVMGLVSIYGVKTNINTQYLVETSRLVEKMTGIKIPPNYPIVGENAFAHESGIHTHGVISDSRTFEPGFMTPEMVGHRRRIVSGKHAGVHGINAMLDELGFKVSDPQLKEITNRVKDLGDKGKKVTDADLHAIATTVMGEVSKEEKAVELEEYVVVTGNKIHPTASVRLRFEDKSITGANTGVGPVDAALNAIRHTLKDIEDISLKEYNLEAITGGSNALAEVIVKLEDSRGFIVTGSAAREDIVTASLEAMISGINRIFLTRKKD
jgi:2-isopropylmalate synthase